MNENLCLTHLFHATFQHLSYPKYYFFKSQKSVEKQQEEKIKRHEILIKKIISGFNLGFI